MSNQMMNSAKRKIATLTVFLITHLLLPPITPVLAHNTESIEVQKVVDEALGVTELPEPATVHLQAPHTVIPPLTGQPYDPYQQPAVAQDDFRPASGSGRR